MKKSMLIVVQHLTVGGVQKALISALRAIDYDKYDVTLYLRKNRTILLPMVDKRVKVIINENEPPYYRRPLAVIYQLLILFFKIFGFREKEKEYNKRLSMQICEYGMAHEQKKYFKDKEYDIAISFVHGYVALFTHNCIKAKEKILFHQSSTDELREVHKKIITGFDKIVTQHDELKRLMAEWYPEVKDRITVIENYIDTDTITAQSKEYSVEKPENKTVLCSCGRFAPVKGFDLAVEAAEKLKNSSVNFIWYLVGDGPEREKLEKLIEKYSLQNEIVITGMQTNPYPYMSACDVYIQPSYEEAVGLTILEAHRLNKPVISTKTVGGLKLIDSGENGLLCDINVKSLAETVNSLVTDCKQYKKIVNNLKNTDYSAEFERYKAQWKNLLEG